MDRNRPLNAQELAQLVHEMEVQSQTSIFNPTESQTKAPQKGRSWKSFAKRFLLSVFLVSFTIPSTILLFPRLAVYYSYSNIKPLFSLSLSFIIVLCIWLICFKGISYLLTGKFKTNRYIQRIMMISLVAYLGFSTLFLSNAHIKNKSIKQTYLNLHPVLRVGLTTIILADTDLIITNTQRTKDDYLKWGLSKKERSHHFIQAETGFVHAVDIRTIGRPEWQNTLVQFGFKVMGFKTLRHIGTADHLHVYLPLSK